MKTFRSILALLFALPALSYGDDATAEREVRAATAEWIATFNTRDAAQIAALYAPDAVFWGTVSQTIRTTPAEVLEYHTASATRRPTLKMYLGEQHVQVFGNIAINSGAYTSKYVKDGEEIVTPMRFTFAFRREGDRWTIVTHHSSRMPAP